MKTDDLIRALAADRIEPSPPIGARIAVALAAGGAVAVAAFLWFLGPRPDLVVVATTARFLLKPVASVVLAATALAVVLAIARPVHDRRAARALALAPLLLALGVAAELLAIPPAGWAARAVGSNALICLTAVPLLATAPLLALLVALRRGAPTSPTGAGAVAGLAAGGLAAALYALHCNDDSPLFVAVWYTPAIAIVAFVGALLGRRLLRW